MATSPTSRTLWCFRMKLLQSRVLTVAVDHGELAINTDRSQASRAAGAVWLRQGPAVLFFPGAGNLWQVEVFDTKLYVVERLLCQFRKSRISGITHCWFARGSLFRCDKQRESDQDYQFQLTSILKTKERKRRERNGRKPSN